MNMDIERLLAPLKDRQAQVMDRDAYRHSGVLIPLVKVDSETHVLFEVRSMQLRSQPGDICFPGGRLDESDASIMACAIRETEEEIGIQANQIDHVVPLDYIISGSSIIYPFAGMLSAVSSITPNKMEVAEVFTVPLPFFIENDPRVHKIHFTVEPEKDFPFDLIQNGKSYDWRVREMKELFYEYEGRVIWGLTAKIIHHFVQLLSDRTGGQV